MSGSARVRITWLAGWSGVVLGLGLMFASPAQAQFVCDPGGGAVAPAPGSMACGTGAGTNNVANENNIAVGNSAGTSVDGADNSAFGTAAGQTVTGVRNTAVGNFAGSNVTGSNNTASGYNSGNDVNGGDNTASGLASGNDVTGNANTASGLASGQNVTGDRNVAVGSRAGSNINASDTVSIGTNAVASANGAVAIGNGAVATRANQQSFGTSNSSYTLAGLASAASKAAQSGTTYLVTSDAQGNLATTAFSPQQIEQNLDALGRRDDELAGGIAIALSLAQPMIRPGQTFAMRLGWGNFDGENAVGLTAAGVVSQGDFGPTSSVIVDGGVGTARDQVAGRGGVSFGW
jgi:trimeric autotransporter adhesin